MLCSFRPVDDSQMGKLQETYWPEMTTAAAARKSIKTAALTAYTIAGLTAILALLAWYNVVHLIPPLALADAVVFAVLGFFILNGSRVASILGLIFYICEAVSRVISVGNSGTGVLTIIFTLYFINGVRGSFALVRLPAFPQVMLRQFDDNVDHALVSPSPKEEQRFGIRSCASCRTKVIPTAQGICPACQKTA